MIPDLQMNAWWQYVVCVISFIIGIFFLIKGSDTMVSGAASLAKKFKVSGMVIGLTVVAFGTSFPELAVSVSDSISCLFDGGHAEVAIGNVVGSNICNIFIVLGFSAVFTPIIIKRKTLIREMPVLLFVTGLLVLFGLVAPTTPPYEINRLEGGILIAIMIAYTVALVLLSKKENKNKPIEETKKEEDNIKEYSKLKSILMTLIGLIVVVIGGEATCFGAKNIALGIGNASGADPNLVSSIVGLTVVAIGTSLPELVTSTVAAKRGQNDIALGNVIGSNIFNIGFVLGLSALVTPLLSGSQLMVDLLVMLGAAIVLLVFAFIGKINRWSGFLFIALYFAYVAYLICRTAGLV